MNNKFIIKIISIILIAVMPLSFIACRKGGNDKTDNGGSEPITAENSNHVYKAEDTDKYVVYNKKTNYRLVIPNNASSKIQTAKSEFVYLFKKATGVELQVITDNVLTHNAANKYISLGNTKLLNTCGENIDYTRITGEAVRIFTKDDTIFLASASDNGVINSVYTFMQINFNFDTFAYGVDTIDEVDNFKLKNYDVIDIPDIAHRENSLQILSATTEDYDQNNCKNRMRYYERHSVPTVIDEHGAWETSNLKYGVHNTASALLPIEQWYDNGNHWKWFSDSSKKGDGINSQLCYTCHGDEQMQEEMVNEIFRKYKISIEMCSDAWWEDSGNIAFGCDDNYNFCHCESCSAEQQKYGCETGAAIKIANRVAVKLKEWMDSLPENHPRKKDDFNVYFTAYYDYSIAPAGYDENNGTYYPIDDSVKLADNLCIYLCYIDINYQKSAFSEDSSKFIEQSKAWKALGEKLVYYLYDNNYICQPYFYDGFSFYTQDIFKFFKEMNTQYIYLLTQSRMPCQPTAYNYLKAYLDSKLAWDCSLNYEELVNKWFQGVYKDAWKEMKEIFISTRAHYMQFTTIKNGLNGAGKTVQQQVEVARYWPIEVLNSWIDAYDNVYKAIEKYKLADPELYEQICYNIELECLSPLIIKARLHYSSLSQTEKDELRDRLYRDIDWLDVGGMVFNEGNTANNLSSFVSSL